MIQALIYRCLVLTMLVAVHTVSVGSSGNFKVDTPTDRDTHSLGTRQTDSFSSDTRTAPRVLRLFGQNIEASASSQLPASPLVPPKPTFRLPPRQVVFRSDNVPLVERHVAQLMANAISGGDPTPIDPSFFNYHKRKELSNWSRAQFVDPEAEFFLHHVPPTRELPYFYFAKALPWDELRDPTLRKEQLEEQLGDPFVVYRARVGTSNFWRDGEIEIAGVELFSKPSTSRASQQASQTVKLRDLFQHIERASAFA